MRWRDLPYVLLGRLSPWTQRDVARAERDRYRARCGELAGRVSVLRAKVRELEAAVTDGQETET